MARHTTRANSDDADRHGLLQATIDVFLDRTRTVAELVATAGGSALGKVPEPVPSAVTRMLASLRQLAEQAPPLTAELDVLVDEVHAKRLSIQALQAELAALDRQLDVLERSLTPLQAWGRQWERLQKALTRTLDLPES
jgi:chromosome segregation ATPase